MSAIFPVVLGTVLFLAACVLLVQLAQARDGYEDDAGFHFGKRQDCRRKGRILPKTKFRGGFAHKVDSAGGKTPQPDVVTPRRV